MTVKALRAIADGKVRSQSSSGRIRRHQANGDPQNGLGAFVLQCKKLDFHYCDWAGSSKGMK